MNTFHQFLDQKLNEVAPPGAAPPPTGGISTPASMPPAGAPPIGGGMPMGGGMGMPPMAGGMGSPTPGTTPTKLKAYNVWDVLERVLGDES